MGTGLPACASRIRRQGRLRPRVLWRSFARLGGLCYRNHMVPSEQAYRRFQRRVDRLCFLIVATDIPERDIAIERLFLSTEAARLFPERFRFYKMLYESRFRRLLEQFRHSR